MLSKSYAIFKCSIRIFNRIFSLLDFIRQNMMSSEMLFVDGYGLGYDADCLNQGYTSNCIC